MIRKVIYYAACILFPVSITVFWTCPRLAQQEREEAEKQREEDEKQRRQSDCVRVLECIDRSVARSACNELFPACAEPLDLPTSEPEDL